MWIPVALHQQHLVLILAVLVGGYWYLIVLICSFLVTHNREGSSTPLQYSCLENPMDGGAWSEKAMAPYPSTLAWKIPRMEEPGRLQSVGSLRVGHYWATSLSLFTFLPWRRKWNPLQCSCLENPRDREAWWAAIYGVAQSWTRLKWLSSSSSSRVYFGFYNL